LIDLIPFILSDLDFSFDVSFFQVLKCLLNTALWVVLLPQQVDLVFDVADKSTRFAFLLSYSPLHQDLTNLPLVGVLKLISVVSLEGLDLLYLNVTGSKRCLCRWRVGKPEILHIVARLLQHSLPLGED
jgi:hypothetical protein